MPLAAPPANLSVYCAMYLPAPATEPKRRNPPLIYDIFFLLRAPHRAVSDEMHKGLAEREREKSLRITQRPSDSNYARGG